MDKNTLKRLSYPFKHKHVRWRDGEKTKDGARKSIYPYINVNYVQQRLDQVVPGQWEFEWEPVSQINKGDSPAYISVKGRLCIGGLCQEDAGEAFQKGSKPAQLKSAVSDCLKRCAAQFGVGRYLNYLKKVYVDAKYPTRAKGYPLERWAVPKTPECERFVARLWGEPGDEPGEPGDEEEPIEQKDEEQGASGIRPYAPEFLRKRMMLITAEAEGQVVKLSTTQRGITARAIEELFETEQTSRRHTVLDALFGKPSIIEITDAEVYALRRWLGLDGNGNVEREVVKAEAEALVNEYLETHGALAA